MAGSGYTQCECCGDDTVSSDMDKPEPCELCAEAGCSMEEGDVCERSEEAEEPPYAAESLDSDDGPIEAIRKERGGVWDIQHPGGDFQFAGDRNEVRAVLRRIQKNEHPYVKGLGV